MAERRSGYILAAAVLCGAVGVSCDQGDPGSGASNVVSYGEPIGVCSGSVSGPAEVHSSVVGLIAARQDAVSVTGWSHSGDGLEIVGVALMPSTAGGGVGLEGFPPEVFTDLGVEFQVVGDEPAVLPAVTASPDPSQPPDVAQLVVVGYRLEGGRSNGYLEGVDLAVVGQAGEKEAVSLTSKLYMTTDPCPGL